ncbi:MAG: hypothetical protein H6Q43_3759 [Deltaproteobacteria bacterium]|nr:hypothetical protein [Deltaproteobacteria bacterium]
MAISKEEVIRAVAAGEIGKRNLADHSDQRG